MKDLALNLISRLTGHYKCTLTQPVEQPVYSRRIPNFSLLKPERTHADNSDKYMDIKELSETALLDHAMTSKKRSKAIEEFLKLTFKSQVDSNCCHEDLVNLGLFSFEFSLKSSSI